MTALLARVRQAFASPVETQTDVEKLAAVDERLATVDAETKEVESKLARRSTARDELRDERVGLAKLIERGYDAGARAKYQELSGRDHDLELLIARGQQALASLKGDRETLAAERAQLLGRVETARRCDAERDAARAYVEAAHVADRANADAVRATERVMDCFEQWRTATIANGGSAPSTQPVAVALAGHWCTVKLMARMGTSIVLSVSQSAAAGRITFYDLTKHLAPGSDE